MNFIYSLFYGYIIKAYLLSSKNFILELKLNFLLK